MLALDAFWIQFPGAKRERADIDYALRRSCCVIVVTSARKYVAGRSDRPGGGRP